MEHYGINAPIWLSEHDIEDKWLDSAHSVNGEVHEWVLGDATITFDGETYHFLAVNPNNPMEVVERIFTEDEGLIV